MQFDIEEDSHSQQINCLRILTNEEWFREALGDLYSDRYFKNHKQCLGNHLFIFEIKVNERSWKYFLNYLVSSKTAYRS
jgi:hypothetical protein